MKMFAIIEDNTVINTIVAESISVAQELSGKTCVESTEESPIGIGFIWSNSENKYVSPIPPQPFPSWQYNGTLWYAPSYPEDGNINGLMWDETNSSWIPDPTIPTE